MAPTPLPSCAAAAAHAGPGAGLAGELVWPLFHGTVNEHGFELAAWQAYRKLNRGCARAIARAVAGPAGRVEGELFVWVLGHQLMGLAGELARRRVPVAAGLFLPIPFPPAESFCRLPWRERLLGGLLSFRQVGFQSARDLDHFLGCVRLLAAEVEITHTAPDRCRLRGRLGGRWCETGAGVFPQGIDFAAVARRAGGADAERLLASLRRSFHGRRVVLGIDTLDRSQGILEKLRAFAELLAAKPALREKVVLVEAVSPAPQGTAPQAASRSLRAEVERLVGAINGRLGSPGWVPVHYMHCAPGADELLAWLRLADVALVTPLAEGMSLLAKAYVAADLEERGALVLSELSGAAPQLAGGALLVNPHDAGGTARALHEALRMPAGERRARMRRMRPEAATHDLFSWADAFLTAACGPAAAAVAAVAARR